MIDFRIAQNQIAAQAKTFEIEVIALEDADGRVLAEDIIADRDYPPFNRSAMDGYALCLNDWQNGIREFTIQEIIYAGMEPSKPLTKGCCYKIMTGSSVPYPANVVIRREDAIQTNNHVSFSIDIIKPFQNIAQKGEDLKTETIALYKNNICNAALISTLATLGKTSVPVYKLPRVAFFTTGNEVKPAMAAINPFEIRNSNEWLIKSLLKKWLIKPELYQHIDDHPEDLEKFINQAKAFDILIMCGGVSAGDADYVPAVMEKLRIKKLFHKVAIKPGKPIWCGKLPLGGIVFALPGNPFSCLVTFKLFIETYLSCSFGLSELKPLSLPFKGNRMKKSNLDEFFPVKISGNPSALSATDINGSGDIRLGVYADGLAHHPKENPELSSGINIYYYRLS